MIGSPPEQDLLLGGEIVESFAAIGVRAFTTGRAAGSFGMLTDEPVRDVMARWSALRAHVGGNGARLATAIQVHGTTILDHSEQWRGWLRADEADGHMAFSRGTAMAVTVALPRDLRREDMLLNTSRRGG